MGSVCFYHVGHLPRVVFDLDHVDSLIWPGGMAHFIKQLASLNRSDDLLKGDSPGYLQEQVLFLIPPKLVHELIVHLIDDFFKKNLKSPS